MTDLAAIVARPTDELERLAATATPGPWRASIGRVGVGALSSERRSLLLASVHADAGRDTAFAERHADAAYIAAVSPDVVLALLADRRALLALLRETQKALLHVSMRRHTSRDACDGCRNVKAQIAAALDTEVPA